MTIRMLLALTILPLLGLNGFLYASGQTLQKEFDANSRQCEQWLAGLEQQQQRPAPQKVKVISAPAPALEQKESGEEEEVVMEKLVSHRHKVQAVGRKYEFLLITAQVDENEKKLLERLLVRRERLADAVYQAELQGADNFAELEEKLYETEDQIELVLTDSLDYDRYQFLRERRL